MTDIVTNDVDAVGIQQKRPSSTKMLTSFSEYKPSGVTWVGDIPKHWTFGALKRGLDRIYSGGTPESSNELYWANDQSGVPFVMIGDMSTVSDVWQTSRCISLAGISSKNLDVVPPDTVLYSMYASVGKVAILRTPAVVNQAILGLAGKRNKITQEYLARWLSCWERNVHVLTNESTQANLNLEIVKNIPTAFPPIEEQQAIAVFLDAMDERVNRFIAARRRMIALLEEQKQAIITQAVTMGLAPDSLMKPSGVDWLGDIPAHWNVRRGSSLFWERKETGRPELPILEVSINSGVSVRDFDNSKRKQQMSDRAAYKVAMEGDLPYNMMRMWQGAVGVAPVDGLVSPAYVVLAPRRGVSSQYFSLLFRTAECKAMFGRESRGIVSDRDRLYWDSFKAISFAVPSTTEQDRIVQFIGDESHLIDATARRYKSEIVLIQEYRTRLISDVVTGKLDVRGALSNL